MAIASNTPRDLDGLTLRVDQELERPPAPAPDSADDHDLLDDWGFVGLGGSGQRILLYLIALFLRTNLRLHTLFVDNDHTELAALPLPGGRLVGRPQADFLRLGEGVNRTTLREYPLLKERYEDPITGLLRGVSVYETYALPGWGGHGIRALTTADIDLAFAPQNPILPRRLRQYLRRWASEPRSQRAWWQHEPDAQPSRARRPRIMLLASGVGGCGSPLTYLLPYALRREARQLHLPEPLIYLTLVGPHAFTGLTSNVYENYAATLADLAAASHHGVSWPLLDGSTLGDSLPPYARVFLLDSQTALERLDADPAASADRDILDECYRDVAKTLYLLLNSTALDQYETAAANAQPERRTPWTTLAGVQADAQTDLLRDILAESQAANRLALAGRP